MDAANRPDLSEVKHRCTACSNVVRLVYIPLETAAPATWQCPMRRCRVAQTRDLKGQLIKAFAGTLIEQKGVS